MAEPWATIVMMTLGYFAGTALAEKRIISLGLAVFAMGSFLALSRTP